MSKIIFTNILGSFVFDEKLKLVKKGKKENLLKKYKAGKATKEQTKKLLKHFKNKKYFSDFYKKNLLITKKRLKKSVKNDLLIIQTISSIEEQNRVINILAKRLREWYELYNPEFSKQVTDHENFVNKIIKKNKKELLREIKLDEEKTMGADLPKEDLDIIVDLAREVDRLYKLKERQTRYLERLMKKTCPNVNEVSGSLIGAKLISLAGSLEKLSELPSSTIQLLGAEKALFRHLRTGAKVPKHGILFQHPLISKTKKRMHGKVARALADKISIATKVDYFKGKFIGNKLKRELEERFK